MAQAVVAGRLTIPIARRFPLEQAAQAHAEAKGAAGKFILVVNPFA
jgi:NADPH:quinone reductase-like Zn-dependent oxidoreductase